MNTFARPRTWPGWLLLVIWGVFFAISVFSNVDFVIGFARGRTGKDLLEFLTTRTGQLLTLLAGFSWILMAGSTPERKSKTEARASSDAGESAAVSPQDWKDPDQNESPEPGHQGSTITALSGIYRDVNLADGNLVQTESDGTYTLSCVGIRNVPGEDGSTVLLTDVGADFQIGYQTAEGYHPRAYIEKGYWLNQRDSTCSIRPGETALLAVVARKGEERFFVGSRPEGGVHLFSYTAHEDTSVALGLVVTYPNGRVVREELDILVYRVWNQLHLMGWR